MWFYQEIDEPESVVQPEPTKPGPSRAAVGTSNSSKTPQGNSASLKVMKLGKKGNSRPQWKIVEHTVHLTQSKLNSTFNRITTSNLSVCFVDLGTTPAGPIHKHKLFLTDGWSCAFTGVCIYIFRINTTKQLPEEGFQKDLWVFFLSSVLLFVSFWLSVSSRDDTFIFILLLPLIWYSELNAYLVPLWSVCLSYFVRGKHIDGWMKR